MNRDFSPWQNSQSATYTHGSSYDDERTGNAADDVEEVTEPNRPDREGGPVEQ